jgi:hypothetical protein
MARLPGITREFLLIAAALSSAACLSDAEAFTEKSGEDGGGSAGASAAGAPGESSAGTSSAGSTSALDAADAGCAVIRVTSATFGANCSVPGGCAAGTSCQSADVSYWVRTGPGPSTPCEGQASCVYYAGAGCSCTDDPECVSCEAQGCARDFVVEYDCVVGDRIAESKSATAEAEAWGQPVELRCDC